MRPPCASALDAHALGDRAVLEAIAGAHVLASRARGRPGVERDVDAQAPARDLLQERLGNGQIHAEPAGVRLDGLDLHRLLDEETAHVGLRTADANPECRGRDRHTTLQWRSATAWAASVLLVASL